MRVLYPKLVEEAYKYIVEAEPSVKHAPNAIKAEIYSKMVNDGIIDENGEPTQECVNRGFVDGGSELEHEPATLAEFKELYPCYKEYDDSHFSHTEQGWAIDWYVMKSLSLKVLNDPESTKEQREFACQALQEIEWFS
ncbi:hypothetical protein [Lactiplantibacillus plantarum]|uniref:hypothetical protein n=1 Tax=Lactiplantibacillus plantarum TaxID=1590 RepID=UPI001BA9CB1F|nr:hypothetical protein [Lactiplantibacillus plantarum]MBS0937404.1 hypothetical protein [Lactiplantibacillus plantarum]MBS0945552.1 hypothetical protein [Lactiplantibacillus plantarum]